MCSNFINVPQKASLANGWYVCTKNSYYHFEIPTLIIERQNLFTIFPTINSYLLCSIYNEYFAGWHEFVYILMLEHHRVKQILHRPKKSMHSFFNQMFVKGGIEWFGLHVVLYAWEPKKSIAIMRRPLLDVFKHMCK